MSKVYADFLELAKEIRTLNQVEHILGWDQNVMMPPGAIKAREPQMTLMSTITHQKLTSDTLGGLLAELRKPAVQEVLSPEQRANVREIGRDHDKAKAVPIELVKELSKTATLAFEEWVKAKKDSDFAKFEPWLVKMVELKKEEAEYIGYEDSPYDALMDGFEPGLTSKEVEELFSDLRSKLVPIVTKIIESGIRPDISPVTGNFDIEKQKEFNAQLAKDLNYNFDWGRIDIAPHPFTTGNMYDTRITTRYKEDDLRPAMMATIHETGHALYEQGFLEENYLTPMAKNVSLGIHESQSRTWENIIGRSLPFWNHYFPKLQSAFPDHLGGKGPEDLYRALNDVCPSLIRVEADEITYNLHILLRFEIESGLFTGKLDAKEAPQVWNENMDKYLQVEVPDDARGVLQDVHWSYGYFGYFPTYTLGNLYGVQFFRTAEEELGGVYDKVEKGEFAAVLEWYREKIHRKGRLLKAKDLVVDVTGKPLSIDPFVDYLNTKFGPLYDF
jgi:carboxypeptidase Taq